VPPFPEASSTLRSVASAREPQKHGELPGSAGSAGGIGKLPQVRTRRGRQQTGPTRDIGAVTHAMKVGPIWLGSGSKEEQIVVREIKSIVPEEMHHNENVLAIERFESDAGPYESQRQYVMAAECLEQAINLRRKFLGDMHQDFLTAIERYVVSCNLWGIQCLNSGQNSSSLELLLKAEAMTEADNVPNFKRRVSLRAATFNNLCCYFRARGKLNAALQFAEKALKIEQRFKDAENPARTHLNYAVLLSMMNRHEESVEHIESAIAILHDEERQISYEYGEPSDGGKSLREVQHQEVVSVLVVAYYNLWVELGRLSRREAGVDCILRAANIAKRKLGPTHTLTVKMEETLSLVQESLTKAPALTHALEDTGLPGDLPHGERQAYLPPGASQLPALDSRAAWQGAKKTWDDTAMKFGVDEPQITIRYVREPLKPPMRPPGERPRSLEGSLRQLKLKEHIYGRATKPIPPEVNNPFFDQRARLESTPGFLGSPALQQKAYGAQPLLSARQSRSAGGPRRPVHSPLSARPLTTHSAQSALAAGGPTAATPRPLAPLEPKQPTEAPASPYLRDAYAYHLKQAQKRRSMEKEPDVPLEADRLRAIGVFRARLDQRRERGLPTATESNRIRAATLIQARFRGYLARQWTIEELAKEMRRRRQMEAADAHRSQQVTAMEEAPVMEPVAPSGPAPRPGPADMKRRVAFRVVYAARRAFVEYSAAVKVQKTWRGWVARRDITIEIARVAHETATKIQALYRRYTTASLFLWRHWAASKVQSAWRRCLAKRVAQKRLQSVRLLTRVALGYATRKRLRVSKQAAVPLQCNLRGFLVRSRAQRQQRGALMMQKVFRGWICRRRAEIKRAAAGRIAALWHGHYTRRCNHQRNAAALWIQRRWRLAHDNALGFKQHSAASKIGANWRGYQNRKTKPYRASACKIQAHFRGMLVREQLRKRPMAALKIERFWRSYQSRYRFKTQVALGIVLQKLTRRHLADHRLRLIAAAAVVCQRLVRGNRFRAQHDGMHAKAKRIQAFWRRFRQRWRLIRAELAAQKIQTFVRGSRARHWFLVRKRATHRIGAGWSSHCIRKSLRRQRAAALCITPVYRGHLVRSKVHRIRTAVIQIQRFARGLIARASLRRRRRACSRIQAGLRAKMTQDRFLVLRNIAVIGIQKAWRRKQAQRLYVKKRNLAIAVESAWRGCKERQTLERQHEEATRIQAQWRRTRCV